MQTGYGECWHCGEWGRPRRGCPHLNDPAKGKGSFDALKGGKGNGNNCKGGKGENAKMDREQAMGTITYHQEKVCVKVEIRSTQIGTMRGEREIMEITIIAATITPIWRMG